MKPLYETCVMCGDSKGEWWLCGAKPLCKACHDPGCVVPSLETEENLVKYREGGEQLMHSCNHPEMTFLGGTVWEGCQVIVWNCPACEDQWVWDIRRGWQNLEREVRS